jgi:hypothetical protein
MKELKTNKDGKNEFLDPIFEDIENKTSKLDIKELKKLVEDLDFELVFLQGQQKGIEHSKSFIIEMIKQFNDKIK